MAVNKVEINGEVKLDLTQDTVTENTLLKGVTAHDAAGNPVEGKVVTTPVPKTSDLLKGDGVGGVSAAVPGTDYLAESDIVYCHITDAGSDLASDMTPAEICEAVESGKLVYAVDSTRTYPVVAASPNISQFSITLLNGRVVGYQISASGVTQVTRGLQDSADKVKSVSAESTDKQYPSAKAVWNALIARVPSVTTADNGKFLRVVNGVWAAAAIDNANGVSF